jgi:quercetin dioxygenase-like cupin family protein
MATPESPVRHYRWADLPKEQVTPQLSRRLVTGERMMLAHVYLDKGCVVPKHSHENEQLTYILEGALHFRIGETGEEEIIVRAGEVLLIPSNVPHMAVASRTRSTSTSSARPGRTGWTIRTATSTRSRRGPR